MDIELPEIKKVRPIEKIVIFTLTTVFFIIGFAMNIVYR